MLFFYSALVYLLSPLAFLYFFWRGLREPVYLRGWHQRFGVGRRRAGDCFWIHAASVGEVQAATPLIKALKSAHPDRPICLTCFTPTGLAHARRQFADDIDCRLLPLDFPGATRRFVKRQAPVMLVIIETEIWPNLLAACRGASVPVVFANARVRPKSVRGYSRGFLKSLFGDALRRVDRVAAASEEDAQRFVELGVPESRVEVTGNLKFDFDITDAVRQQGIAWREAWGGQSRPVWIAGSTHEGEEALILAAHEKLRTQRQDLLLVLVPRHPARFNVVADMCRRFGFKTARRSEQHRVTLATDVLLGDTLGELLGFYAAADVALVGGTLVQGIGGHNILEPAALGVPIIVGKNVEAWAEPANWLSQAGALITCRDADEIATALEEALADTEGRQAAGRAAIEVVRQRGGAVARTQELIEALLP